ncbi:MULTISPECIES: hypothetical protein [Burkholderia cepacia complex]|uniref:hypothetical protein n=1 Tax=Burkholderia cepacia complex TaxID=87882 RepID=UPI000AFB82EB|nr:MULTISPECIES: hypothetical protein [Burkholderia cepacia complex]
MSQKSSRSKGSIYDTLFVKEVIRATKSELPPAQGRLNVLDASQQRRGGSLASLMLSEHATGMLRKGRK